MGAPVLKADFSSGRSRAGPRRTATVNDMILSGVVDVFQLSEEEEMDVG